MFGSALCGSGTRKDVYFASSHKVIGELLDVLQSDFREETGCSKDCAPSQTNTLLALDEQVAGAMIAYMSAKLKELGGFLESEFKFIRKTSRGAVKLPYIRLEFPQGVTEKVFNRIVFILALLTRQREFINLTPLALTPCA